MSDIKSLDDLKAAVGTVAPAAVEAAPRVAVRDKLGRAYATGKRKNAIARVWIKPGSGKVVVNGKEMAVYFARPVLQMILRQPFTVANVEGRTTEATARHLRSALARLAPRGRLVAITGAGFSPDTPTWSETLKVNLVFPSFRPMISTKLLKISVSVMIPTTAPMASTTTNPAIW